MVTIKGENWDTIREVTLEELLNLEHCSWTCDSMDDVWQLYFVRTSETMFDGYFVKIKHDIVKHYLDEKDNQNKEV